MTTFSYSDGALSAVSGSDQVVGSATAWSTQVKAGDSVLAIVGDGGSPEAFRWEMIGIVGSVDSDLAITLLDVYQGQSFTGASYRITRGIAHLSGAAANETLIQFLTELGPLGLAGAGSGPPPSTSGRENQLYVDYTNRVLYQRRAAVWNVVSTVAQTFNPRGDWDSGESPAVIFSKNDLVNHMGYVFVSNVDDNIDHEPPFVGSPLQPTSDENWTWLPLPEGPGDIFALSFSIGNKPLASEVFEGHVFVDTISFPAGLGTSKAVARVAATAETIFSIRKNGVEVGTITFAAASTNGVFAAALSIDCVSGDFIDLVAPASQDDTLSGIKITLRGTR